MTTATKEKAIKIVTGRFADITNEQYHKEMLWAYSKSDIEAGMLSASNLIQRRRGPSTDSAALEFGTALHSRLEHYDNQDAYLKLVGVPPTVDKRTAAGKAAYEKWEAENEAPIVLDQKQWDMLENMLLAVQAHPDARELLIAKGINEETFVWKDKDTGVLCKCRPDKWFPNAPAGMPDGLVLDWKSAASCDRKDLQNAIGERFYDVSAAFTLDGMAQVLGHDVGPFVNVFIEKGSRYRVVLGVMDDSAIEEGRRIYKEQLAKIAQCQKDEIWPGFVDFTLPAWRVMR